MASSGMLMLADLNDFLTPSQACIKPVSETRLPPGPGSAATEIRIDSSGGYYEVQSNVPKVLEKAQINLNDCLACSGCITSAESVLITLQSIAEVLSVLSSNPPITSPAHRIPILSVSPQSLASLVASIRMRTSIHTSTKQVLRRIQRFASRWLKFEYVFDTTFGRHISLLEHVREFQERHDTPKSSTGNSEPSLPMLASSCPGWICYAEKTHSEMLPFISRTKSPQQMMGTLIKHWLARKLCKTPSEIYHVTVMPCYDKKLEASRQDFYDELYSTRDVDCVITTAELELLMSEQDFDLCSPSHEEDEAILPHIFPELLNPPGSSSGSYLQSIISAVSAQARPSPVTLDTRFIRADYEEFTIRNIDTGEPIFKGAKCYGFRNLQNLVRKIGKDSGIAVGKGAAGRLSGRTKQQRSKGGPELRAYDYVEVMACPSGCVNGGGQLTRPPSTQVIEGIDVPPPPAANRWGDKAWVDQVEHAYWEESTTSSEDEERRADSLAVEILTDMCLPNTALDRGWSTRMDEEAETKRRELFATCYQKVESEVVGLAVKW